MCMRVSTYLNQIIHGGYLRKLLRDSYNKAMPVLKSTGIALLLFGNRPSEELCCRCRHWSRCVIHQVNFDIG